MRARQIHRSWAKSVVFLRGCRAGFLERSFARLVIPVLITVLPIFCCHRALPPSRGPYCLPSMPPAASGDEIASPPVQLGTRYRLLGTSYNRPMTEEILPVAPLRCNCSVIGDETSREAMVIDPGDDLQEVLALIRKHDLQVKQIVITHAHIDHVGGAMKLRAATGAPILLNQNDYALLKMLDAQAAWIGVVPPGKVEIDRSVSTGETVTAGSVTANILHTPGHTEGSICLYFAADKKLIAGDTLFAGSIGRTDLPGGSMQKILRSLHDTVLALPDETVVVPGHGPLTTIGEERETNPFLIRT